MSNLTSRKQIRVGDERQLFRPEQLEPGMSIAVVAILEGTEHRERLLRAAAAFTGLFVLHEGQSRLQAAKEAWRHNDPEGLLPLWRGVVERCNEGGAMIELRGEPEASSRDSELVRVDPADLPELEEPMRLWSNFSNMGLAPIKNPPIHLSPGAHTPEAGGWERHATLHLQ
jgi:hypothetical protein